MDGQADGHTDGNQYTTLNFVGRGYIQNKTISIFDVLLL